MEIVKIKEVNEKGETRENIEAVTFMIKDGNIIISLEDLSFLTNISLVSLRNFIKVKHIPYWASVYKRW